MSIPFPGMDPYLEEPAVWEEFHHVFITECMYFLSERLPDTYIAKIGERAELISVSDAAATQYIPATSVALERASRRPPEHEVQQGGATLVASPLTIPSMDSLEVREGYIEIIRLPNVDVYHWGLREPMKSILIPLRSPDPDVELQLGAIVNTAYDRGRCSKKLSYAAAPPSPRLSAEDSEWVDERLRAAGRR